MSLSSVIQRWMHIVSCIGTTLYTPVYRSDVAKIFFNCFNSLELEFCQCDSKPIVMELCGVCVFSTCVKVHPGWSDSRHCCVRMLFIIIVSSCMQTQFIASPIIKPVDLHACWQLKDCFYKKKIKNIIFASRINISINQGLRLFLLSYML